MDPIEMYCEYGIQTSIAAGAARKGDKNGSEKTKKCLRGDLSHENRGVSAFRDNKGPAAAADSR